MLVTRLPETMPGAVDLGRAPSSQPMSLTLTLAQTPARQAALDQFLGELDNPNSPNYRHWVTPETFAARFGATSEQIDAASTWLASQGLVVSALSPSANRITVAGFSGQIERAFATEIHNYQANGHVYFATVENPSMPQTAAGLFLAIDGLDNLPGDLGTILSGNGAQARAAVDFRAADLSIPALAAIVDANQFSLLSIDATVAVGGSSRSRNAGLNALFRQAAAQGITTLVYANVDRSSTYGFPEVTVVAVSSGQVGGETPVADRPSWQIASGLPADALRHSPDIAASDFSDLGRTISSIALKTPGGRLGNINPTLYSLAPLAGLYSQPDNTSPGTWEAPTGLGIVDTARLAQAFPHGTGPTNVQISSSSYSPTHGQSFVLTVNANSTTGGAAPTGTITFTSTQSGFPGTTATLNASGSATSSPYVLPGGTYAITASYSGDANYSPSSGTVNITVQPEAAVFSIAAPATVSLGGTLSATVTLTSASGVGTPSASVTVTPSGITSALAIIQTVAGAGGTAQAVYTFTTNKAGSVALQASCTSLDPSFTCFTPQTSTTTVPQATPKVALTMTPSNPAAGVPVTLSAVVTGVAGIGTTGSVQFFDGSTSLGFGSAPSATFTGNLAPGSSHVITAVYQGDSNYLKATSNAINTSVSTSPTTTTVSASAATLTFGQSVSLNITVATTTVVNGTQPSGTLTFTGAGSTTTAPVSGGSANVTLNNLGVGTWTIGTTYSGDTNYSPSTGNTVTVTVTQATASLSTNLSATAFTTGSISTLTVTVTLPGTAVVPTGSTFIATIPGVTGATYTGIFTVNVGGNTGTGSVTIPAPPLGTYTMQVTCGANVNFTCTPNTLSISSTAIGTGSTGTTPTTTTLAITPAMPAIGQAITMTATVSAAAAAVAANPIAGTIAFYDGTTLIGSGTISTVGSNGVATATYTFTGKVLTHSLTAVYSGNTVYAASTSTALALTLSANAAVITLTSNATNTTAGSSIVLTATISGTTTTGAGATGSVSFYIVGLTPTLIGTATLGTVSGGVSTAVLSTPNLPSGSVTIYATYKGDANFSSGVSNQITIGLSDYALSFVPQNLTVMLGQSGTATVVVTPIAGFTGTITLSCAPPTGIRITCGFNPTVLTGGGVSTLTVGTTLPKGQSINRQPRGAFEATAGVALAALLAWGLPIRGRRRLPPVLLLLTTVGLLFGTGCAPGNFSEIASITAGTPLGTTLLTITTAGTNGSSTVRHNYNYQVTVQ